jgi:hypothetical protein
MLQKQTQNALENLSPHCQDALKADGIDLKAVDAFSGTAQFIDEALQGSQIVDKLVPPNGGDTPSQTVSEFLVDLGPSWARVAFPSGYPLAYTGVIVVSKAFDGLPLRQENLTLVHEALHAFLGQGDIQLAGTLGLGTFDDNNLGRMLASNAIRDYLKHGCRQSRPR